MHMDILPACMFMYHKCPQKPEESLELELQVVVRHCVGTVKQTWVLWKVYKCSLSAEPTLHNPYLYVVPLSHHEVLLHLPTSLNQDSEQLNFLFLCLLSGYWLEQYFPWYFELFHRFSKAPFPAMCLFIYHVTVHHALLKYHGSLFPS